MKVKKPVFAATLLIAGLFLTENAIARAPGKMS